MRTTVSLDDDLLEAITNITGPMGTTELLRESMRAMLQRESAKRLALLGGSEPQLDAVPRRQSSPKAA